MQYLFEDGNEVPVKILLLPHGNAKRSSSHCRTQSSTLKMMEVEKAVYEMGEYKFCSKYES